MGTAEIEKWKEFQRNLWRDVHYLLTCTELGAGVGEYNIPKAEDINRIESEIVFEVGEEKDKLHAHGIVRVYHYTNLRMNFKLINNILAEQNGYPQYFRAFTTRDDQSNIVEYMRKQSSYVEKLL